jgi:hypothetical protein
MPELWRVQLRVEFVLPVASWSVAGRRRRGFALIDKADLPETGERGASCP